MPPKERKKLRSIVETAHANGQRVRFWETPEFSPQREAVWRELLAARVDYIQHRPPGRPGDVPAPERPQPHRSLRLVG